MRTIERARKSVDETGRRYEAAFKSRISLFEKYNPCRVTSKLITCRECDSKINREVFGQKISLVNYVKCPVCGSKTGLYSNTANERFMVAEKKVKNTRDAYDKAKLEYGKMKADREKSGKSTDKKSAFKKALDETRDRLEIIYDEYEAPDYVEIKGEIGGDMLCFRVCRDGSVYER